MTATFDIVVPTLGRASLAALLDALAAASGPRPGRILLVFDGHDAGPPLGKSLRERVEVLAGPRGGPAAARNVGWRTSHAEWIAFLDDDVLPDRDWLERLAVDLDVAAHVAGSQGRIRVPLASVRRPTDWERSVKGLEDAAWITADMAYRRSVLEEVGGFDERFPRAYREDADLALRVRRAGYRLARGTRTTAHPVRRGGRLASVRAQAGNADDALMEALHGQGWRERAGVPRGRRRVHLATTAAAAGALTALAAGRPRAAAVCFAGWFASTAEFAWRRIAPGPRTADEVATMLLTSAVIPPAASYHWLGGRLRARRLVTPSRPPAAVLLDRDGTLVRDVPYNGEPDRVLPVPGARAALDRLRDEGIPIAVVSNQSGVARGLISREQVDAVNRRVEELVGPIAAWAVCVHGPDDGCDCRKPAPGLVVQAARALGVDPRDCVVIGDIGADVEAARASGARGILVPDGNTRPEEIQAAPVVAATLGDAVDLVLGGRS